MVIEVTFKEMNHTLDADFGTLFVLAEPSEAETYTGEVEVN